MVNATNTVLSIPLIVNWWKNNNKDQINSNICKYTHTHTHMHSDITISVHGESQDFGSITKDPLICYVSHTHWSQKTNAQLKWQINETSSCFCLPKDGPALNIKELTKNKCQHELSEGHLRRTSGFASINSSQMDRHSWHSVVNQQITGV